MVIPAELLTAVDAAFAITARDTPHWQGPDPMRERRDDEDSRVTNPEKWRILGARADAWVVALQEDGLATVERNADILWSEPPGTMVTRTDLVTPRDPTALPLVVARSRLGGDDDAGLRRRRAQLRVRLVRSRLAG
ncbi:MAG: hypothetical protein JJE52_01655 [Acidimicrobiia bacterium]|nr:hypothetical protein [Acidimicrobiia bacterium]